MGMKQSKSINDAGLYFYLFHFPTHGQSTFQNSTYKQGHLREEEKKINIVSDVGLRILNHSVSIKPLRKSVQRRSKWSRLASIFNTSNAINDMLVDSGCCFRRTGEYTKTLRFDFEISVTYMFFFVFFFYNSTKCIRELWLHQITLTSMGRDFDWQ